MEVLLATLNPLLLNHQAEFVSSVTILDNPTISNLGAP